MSLIQNTYIPAVSIKNVGKKLKLGSGEVNKDSLGGWMLGGKDYFSNMLSENFRDFNNSVGTGTDRASKTNWNVLQQNTVKQNTNTVKKGKLKEVLISTDPNLSLLSAKDAKTKKSDARNMRQKLSHKRQKVAHMVKQEA